MMDYQIKEITSFDNMNGSGILAKVSFLSDDHNKYIVVHVRLPLDKNASLAEVEARALNEAKQQLKSLTSEF
jgi:hypothetical protein